jgi:phenylacetic acid degradation protein PaaD
MSHEGTSGADDATLRARALVQSLYLADFASQWLGIEIIDVVFAFADSAFAFACNSYGDPMVAAGASIEFLAPTPRGERVIATAAEVSRGARHGIYDVAVSAATGAVLAQFRGRCARLRAPT